MKKRAKFKVYNPDQLFFLSPDMKDWLREDLSFKESRLKRIEETKLKANTDDLTPKRLSADSGYFSGSNCEILESEVINQKMSLPTNRI